MMKIQIKTWYSHLSTRGGGGIFSLQRNIPVGRGKSEIWAKIFTLEAEVENRGEGDPKIRKSEYVNNNTSKKIVLIQVENL